jgi:hypothetical protein
MSILCLFFLLFMFSQMVKVSNAKFEVEKFNGKNNFKLWKLKMQDMLVQQGLHKALARQDKETEWV